MNPGYVDSESSVLGFPGGTVGKNLPANAGDTGWISCRKDPTGCRATKPVGHSC